MHDMSLNLPYWARLQGYRLLGNYGTEGELYLYKGGDLMEVWRTRMETPSIIEIEEFIEDVRRNG